MKKSRFTETQIVAILNEADAGIQVKDGAYCLSPFSCQQRNRSSWQKADNRQGL